MPIEKGQVLNPHGRRSGTEALQKVRKAIEKGIEGMRRGGKGKPIGVVVLAEQIRDALEADPIRTLKALASYMPKDLTVDVVDNRQADAMTDGDLASLIAQGAARQIQEENEGINSLLN